MGQAAATAQKAKIEEDLKEAKEKLKNTEKEKKNALGEKKHLEMEVVAIKNDMATIEVAIQKLETEKHNKDHVIKTVHDEVADQDEIINKLTKEKKWLMENAAKAAEDMQGATEKVEHMTKIRNKLESTLGELENSVNKEKAARVTVEKARR